ncbi:putative phosphoesterase [Minicystis rosea]|nr:putative phosphoesterase [Minicystis rosea]
MIAAFWIASIAAAIVIVLTAHRRRGALYARFAAVLLGIHTLVASGLVRHTGVLFPAYAVLQLAVFVHFFMLTQPRMRPLAYRVFVSLPASYFVAATFLAFPWAIAAAFGLRPIGFWIPYVIAGIGLIQSLSARRDEVHVVIDRAPVEGVRRHPHAAPREGRPLTIVQLSDTHLGPFMSVPRLRGFCERAVAAQPDLVLLTGDFLTMESQETHAHLEDALAPLRALPGRVFACHGNHDHEAPALVARALASVGATLLVDEATVIETEAGPVQIVGMDFHFTARKERMAAVCAENPRVDGALRLVLLHDPGAFRHLPEGEGDLVLAGHTHGGQLGLVSLGAVWTVLRLFVDMPDHGLWARGPDRLYVHRGTGHYGFPLRLGVPAEESILRVHRA